MSVPPSPLPPRRQSGSGCLAALMILVGGALLLPGLCVLIFVSSDPQGMLTDPTGLTLLIGCLAVAAGGVALILKAGKLG